MKELKARVAQKRDSAANWAKIETTFVPHAGEIVVYYAIPGCSRQKVKVGDGTTPLKDLPFVETKVLQSLGKSAEDTMSQEAITTAIQNVSHDIDSLMEGLVLDGGVAPPKISATSPVLNGGDAGPQRPNNDPVPDPADANEVRY